MIDRRLPGPIAQPHTIPGHRMLWFSGEYDGMKYALYVSMETTQIVAVLEKDGAVIREGADVYPMFNAWIHELIKENQ